MKLPLSLVMTVGQLRHGVKTVIRISMKFCIKLELLKDQNTSKIGFFSFQKVNTLMCSSLP